MTTSARMLTMIAAVMVTSSVVNAQFRGQTSSSADQCDFGYRATGRTASDNYLPTRDYASPGYGTYSNSGATPWLNNSGYGSGRDIYQTNYQSYSNENRNRYGDPLQSGVPYRPSSGYHSNYDQYPSSMGHGSQWNNRDDDRQYSPSGYSDSYGAGGAGYLNRGRLEDPFRFPSRETGYDTYRNAPLSRENLNGGSGYESRYRIPLESVDYQNSGNGRRRGYEGPNFQGSPGRDSFGSQYNQQPSGLDPFVPTMPPANGNSEVENITKLITARYSNPVNVRSVSSMSASQALQLYREVSQQTDQRHLEPSTYDVRIRRGLRNLSLALDNPAFVQSLRVSADSFNTQSFRDSLSRMATSMQVNNYNDAQNVVQTVMQEAQRVPGLTASVVAFEFANATIDTLDKFSALEPADPTRGAALDNGQVKSASLESEIVGIGVEIKGHDQGLLIMKALRGGPAAEAGLQSGDVILAIDGRNIGGMNMANAVDLMKGNNGSRIRLTVSRNGSRGSDITLTRRAVRVYTVNDMKILNGTDNVAYMSLSQFGQASTQEIDQALQQLYSSNMKSLILDLRGNPGGLLNVCVDITNRFLPCGTIVSTKGRLPADNMIETATFDRTWSTPLVVLIDGDSASASEIFAAAIQENRRGVVVGERSYGKGTVQTHFPLQTVSGNLRLTTARFYSPTGRPMAGEGVMPDVRVTDADGPANGDRVLEEAIRIAQSQQLHDMAAAAKSCKPTATPLIRNSFRQNMFDAPTTVL